MGTDPDQGLTWQSQRIDDRQPAAGKRDVQDLNTSLAALLPAIAMNSVPHDRFPIHVRFPQLLHAAAVAAAAAATPSGVLTRASRVSRS